MSQQGTRFIKFRGNLQTWTVGNSPTDAETGEIGFETTGNQVFIYNGTGWVGGAALTTSTTTSTTTTTTSTSTS